MNFDYIQFADFEDLFKVMYAYVKHFGHLGTSNDVKIVDTATLNVDGTIISKQDADSAKYQILVNWLICREVAQEEFKRLLESKDTCYAEEEYRHIFYKVIAIADDSVAGSFMTPNSYSVQCAMFDVRIVYNNGPEDSILYFGPNKLAYRNLDDSYLYCLGVVAKALDAVETPDPWEVVNDDT